MQQQPKPSKIPLPNPTHRLHMIYTQPLFYALLAFQRGCKSKMIFPSDIRGKHNGTQMKGIKPKISVKY
jgi:hypothetical protein